MKPPSDDPSPAIDAGMQSRLRRIRHVALDLDGTLYLGGTLFAYTPRFLESLEEMEIGYTFFTNNSSRSAREYVFHLGEMGIQAEVDAVYSSVHATIDYLRREFADGSRLFVLGTTGLKEQLGEAGYVIDDADPEVVVVGFDTGLEYGPLCQAAYWIKQGRPFLATHPDLVCPTDQALVLPDCGAICQLLTAATGRPPDAVLGKPNPAMLNGLLERHGLERSQIAMVGDRLYTDVAMARNAGMLGVLVLSGETRRGELDAARDLPDVVAEDVGQFGMMLRDARNRDDV